MVKLSARVHLPPCGHPPLWRKAPGGFWQQDGGERLSCVSVHGAYGRARVAADALRGDPAHACVVGVVDVGVGAGRRIRGRGERGGVHELLVRGALGFTGGAFLTDVQGTLGGKGLREGTAAIALVVVVDVVAKQPTCPLKGERGHRLER